MSQIDAIFRNGVFEPLGQVDFKEEQRVSLNIEPTDTATIDAWLERVRAIYEQILSRRGGNPFPIARPELLRIACDE